ncbi:hypothetical protein [Tsukamurella ocularis]|uniref:hypothetical protein n=1 Tax=Tsukamurella ocularis TaxID=1970234 RepID=UPI002168ACDD|nr:hypothetical protein [Tsukamurella ocularis]MCS3853275.1 hypothetical protein [Tsukamurella ocularis]
MTMTPSAARAALRRYIATLNPQQLADAAAEAERRYRANPKDAAIFATYFGIESAVFKQFPVEYPDETEPPQAAWNDESHSYWKTDPECVFYAAYNALVDSIGHMNARVKVSRMQSNGEKFPA